MQEKITKSIKDHQQLVNQVLETLVDQIENIASTLTNCLQQGGTVFWCGNGGSASDALHLSAELVGRFEKERMAYSSIALSSNISTLTSIGNDYGFDSIFSRQIEGLGRKGDVVIGLSTSGNSKNVIHAIEKAKSLNMNSIGMLGRDGGELKGLCDQAIVIPSDCTARIQEMHIMIGHCVCAYVESNLSL